MYKRHEVGTAIATVGLCVQKVAELTERSRCFFFCLFVFVFVLLFVCLVGFFLLLAQLDSNLGLWASHGISQPRASLSAAPHWVLR